MLSTPLDDWYLYVDKDQHLPRILGEKLLGTDGQFYSYDELLSRVDSSVERQITPEVFSKRYDACQKGLAKLADVFAEAATDVAIVVGDDQEEMFHAANMPALGVLVGDKLISMPANLDTLSPTMRLAAWSYQADLPVDYPSDPGLGQHLAEALIGDGFDINVTLPQEGVSISHAYSFMHRRIMGDRIVPVVPVFINTFYPPNTPTSKRCVELGTAIRQAVKSWHSNKRVAVMCSGGLSHFVVDEELDRTVLDALGKRDSETLAGLPPERLKSGNSEAKNWMALGLAAQHLDMNLVDYVPCYRSPAGTGCAMAFAYWR